MGHKRCIQSLLKPCLDYSPKARMLDGILCQNQAHHHCQHHRQRPWINSRQFQQGQNRQRWHSSLLGLRTIIGTSEHSISAATPPDGRKPYFFRRRNSNIACSQEFNYCQIRPHHQRCRNRTRNNEWQMINNSNGLFRNSLRNQHSRQFQQFQQYPHRPHFQQFHSTTSQSADEIIRPGERIIVNPASMSKRKDKSHKGRKSKQGKGYKGGKGKNEPLPFVDKIRLKTRGGMGGKGCVSFQSLGSYKKSPNGGHGGRGGSVYLITDPRLSTLSMDKHHYYAHDGGKGGRSGMQGRNGKDVFVRVPCGVVVRKVLDVQEEDEDEEGLLENGGIVVNGLSGDEEEEEYDEYSKELFRVESEEEVEDDFEDYTELHAPDEEDDENDELLNASDSSNVELADEVNEDEEADEHDMQDDGSDEQDVEHDPDQGITFSEEEFDAYYESLTPKQKLRLTPRKQLDQLPSDYNEVVDQEVRGLDGMYHWSNDNPDTGEDYLSSSSAYSANPGSGGATQRKTVFLADLDQPHSKLLVASGGNPGIGNKIYASRLHSHNYMTQSIKKSVPKHGELSYLELELKLIADVGLVGFPNAGKSSLLSAMSRAKPKIASYPFTTLHPLVGTIHYRDGYRVVMADVPGLIDGAAEGRGRGVEFLRHVERTKVLVYMVDAVGVDGRCPVSDLRILGKELREYGSSGLVRDGEDIVDDIVGGGEDYDGEEMRRRRKEMMNRPAMILANKMDLLSDEDLQMGRREELLFQLGKTADEVGIVCQEDHILGISAGVTGEGLMVLSKQLREVVTTAKA